MRFLVETCRFQVMNMPFSGHEYAVFMP